MPKSANTVTKNIINFSNKKKEDLKKKIAGLKKKNIKFSLTVDEWTDNCMKRYLNISLHTLIDNEMRNFEMYVLGLVEIKGSCNAQKTKEYVENKLIEFNLDPKSDIISSTHDGAAVMIKYGKLLDNISQLCHNHALHLAVFDTFYKRKTCEIEDEETDCFYGESGTDDDNENDNERMLHQDANINISIDESEEDNPVCVEERFDNVFRNLRKIIKLFKTSSVKNSILQGHVIKQEGRPLKLLLDIKTRWNSIVTMVRRFIKIKDCVDKALVELGIPTFSNENLLILKDVLSVLSPMETAVKELSKNSATLLTAEGVYKFLFDKMEEIDTETSRILLMQLKKRMNERRDKTLLTLMIFLETGNISRSNKHFEYSTKYAAISLAIEIMEKIIRMLILI